MAEEAPFILDELVQGIIPAAIAKPYEFWSSTFHLVTDFLDLFVFVLWLLDCGLFDASLKPQGALADDHMAVEAVGWLVAMGIMIPIVGLGLSLTRNAEARGCPRQTYLYAEFFWDVAEAALIVYLKNRHEAQERHLTVYALLWITTIVDGLVLKGPDALKAQFPGAFGECFSKWVKQRDQPTVCGSAARACQKAHDMVVNACSDVADFCKEYYHICTFLVVLLCAGALVLVYTSSSYDCMDFNGGWGDSKNLWCCQNHGMGCPADGSIKPNEGVGQMASAFAGCQTACDFKGHKSDCAGRIAWATEHRFHGLPDACPLAVALVKGECSFCSACLEEDLPPGCSA